MAGLSTRFNANLQESNQAGAKMESIISNCLSTLWAGTTMEASEKIPGQGISLSVPESGAGVTAGQVFRRSRDLQFGWSGSRPDRKRGRLRWNVIYPVAIKLANEKTSYN